MRSNPVAKNMPKFNKDVIHEEKMRKKKIQNKWERMIEYYEMGRLGRRDYDEKEGESILPKE